MTGKVLILTIGTLLALFPKRTHNQQVEPLISFFSSRCPITVRKHPVVVVKWWMFAQGMTWWRCISIKPMSPEKENSLNDFANTDPIYMWRGAQKLWRSDTQFQSGLSSSVESERQNYFLFVFGGSDYISSWHMPVFRLFLHTGVHNLTRQCQ